MSLYWQWRDRWILHNATSVWEQTEPEKQTKSKLAQEQHILFLCQNQTLAETARNTYKFIVTLLSERETRNKNKHAIFVFLFLIDKFISSTKNIASFPVSLILNLFCLHLNISKGLWDSKFSSFPMQTSCTHSERGHR